MKLLYFCLYQLTGSSERPLKVTQFHFTAWPDHGVPEYATPILAFHKRIMSQYQPRRGPLMVHCRCVPLSMLVLAFCLRVGVHACSLFTP